MSILSASLLFGLLSALSWGSGDFCGGVVSKRVNPYVVVLIVQAAGALLMAVLAFWYGEAPPPWQFWLRPAVAGIAVAIGLVGLYSALASGTMGVVAPVTGVVGATVPIVTAALLHGLPEPVQIAGFLLALVAVWLLAGGGSGRVALRMLVVPVLAGLGFGFYYVMIALDGSGSVWWPLMIARIAASLVIAPHALAALRRVEPAAQSSQATQGIRPGSVLPLLLVASVADAGGNLFYALAAQAGRMDTAAVLSSLYPAVTVGLAWFLLRERLSLSQWAGVAAALFAIPLIAA